MSLHPNVMNVLKLMSDGEYRSGEYLGELLGVSRAAVWKQLQQVSLLGILVESKKGKGYRLSKCLSLLDKEHIISLISPKAWTQMEGLIVESTIESTNGKMMALCNQGQSINGLAILTEMQTAGRGRRGRVWHSPFASNIYLSIGWTFEQGIAFIDGLSLAVAVVVCEVLEAFGLDGCELKWPNDVLANGKKLAGILIELTGDPAGECHVVLGLGLNVDMESTIDDASIDQPWIDLVQLGCRIDRNEVSAHLIEKLVVLLSTFEEKSFSHYRSRWEQRNAFKGVEVTLSTPVKASTGTMLGVTDSGALKLRVDGVEQVYVGGEVSLRKSI